MPPGSTLRWINLPTGSGKTLVGQLPPLLDDGIELTLFVVPTTALALDQARRMQELLARIRGTRETQPLAWHADLPQAAKVAIKQRIGSGSQGILFASPEAVRGALLPSLYHAVSCGLIRHLVIDQAHIVCEWGDGFRPDFQALAGVRAGLMRHGRGEALRTIHRRRLPRRRWGVLETLYGKPGPFQMVAAVHLRPEPRYISVRASSASEKIVRVRDTVRHLAPTTPPLRDGAQRGRRVAPGSQVGRVQANKLRFMGNTPRPGDGIPSSRHGRRIDSMASWRHRRSALAWIRPISGRSYTRQCRRRWIATIRKWDAAGETAGPACPWSCILRKT